MPGTPPHGPEGLRLLADLGLAAAAHAPMIRARPTDSYKRVRAEAARALWRCTGDTASTVPVLVRFLNGYTWLPMFAPVHSVAAECLGHIGRPAEPAAPVLIRYLEADTRRHCGMLRHDPISWDQHGQRLTATVLGWIRPPDPKTRTITPPPVMRQPAPAPKDAGPPESRGADGCLICAPELIVDEAATAAPNQRKETTVKRSGRSPWLVR